MSFSAQFLDEIRARTTLSSLVSQDIAIKKAGREWKGCCPFHSEKTPSFYVNDEKAMYHCFGCGAHGDAIRWMTDQRGIPFVDAVKELAQAAGIPIPASDPRQAERDRERDELFAIMSRADARFVGHLDHGIDYLRSRGISAEVARTFGIGFAPRPNRAPPLYEAMIDVPVAKLEQLGLVKHREDGSTVDMFRGRLIFPIQDNRGRVIGFGGRIIGDGQPKYLNSPDTPIFHKGRTLYNIHRASRAASRNKRLVIAEGYMDVIAFYRAGIEEAVAPNGTALTEDQMTLAWRLVDVPTLCFDGDAAGLAARARAAIRALPMLEPGKSLGFVSPPAGKDPDDVLNESGPDAVAAMLAKPQPLVSVLWQHEMDAEPVDTPEQIAGLKARLRAHVRSIRNADIRDAYGQDIAKRFRDTFDAVSHGIIKPPRSTPAPTRQRRAAPPTASREQKTIARIGLGASVERAILAALIQFPAVLPKTERARFTDAAIGSAIGKLRELFWMNELRNADDVNDVMSEQLATEIDRLCRHGAPLMAFRSEKDLALAVGAMCK